MLSLYVPWSQKKTKFKGKIGLSIYSWYKQLENNIFCRETKIVKMLSQGISIPTYLLFLR